jgi:hypothetical protein
MTEMAIADLGSSKKAAAKANQNFSKSFHVTI